jgi:hypothetical protein
VNYRTECARLAERNAALENELCGLKTVLGCQGASTADAIGIVTAKDERGAALEAELKHSGVYSTLRPMRIDEIQRRVNRTTPGPENVSGECLGMCTEIPYLLKLTKEMREALENCKGHFDTPLARRRFASDSDYPAVIESLRRALALFDADPATKGGGPQKHPDTERVDYIDLIEKEPCAPGCAKFRCKQCKALKIDHPRFGGQFFCSAEGGDARHFIPGVCDCWKKGIGDA